MLLDGYGLVYRGYFALPPLTTSRGELVNGVFGFASIVLRGIADLQPDYLAVSFDLPGPTFRHEHVRRLQGHPPGCPTTCATSSRRSARSSRRCASRSTRCPATRPMTSSARSPSSSKLERGPRDDDRHRRPRHAPARHAADEADDDSVGRREHDHLRRRQDRRAVRPATGPDGRLQGAQGRPDRQHPGRARGRREDRGEAHPRLRQPRRDVRTTSTR